MRRPARPDPITDDLADMLGEASAALAPAALAPAAPAPAVGPAGTVRVRNLHPDTVWLSSGRMEAGEEADVSAADAALLIERGLAEVVS